MANGAVTFTISLADFLATAKDDGTWADIFQTAKTDDVATPASQIKDYAGQLWGNGIDDLFLASYQQLYKGAKLWSVADAAARDALGSDDALGVNDLLFKEDDQTLWYCVSVDGASASTWASISSAGDVTGPAGATDHAVARYDGAGGKTIQDSVVIISDAGAMSGITNITLSGTVDGVDVSATGASLTAHLADTANPHATSLTKALATGGVTGGNDLEVSAADAFIMVENGAVPGGAPAAGKGKLWVKSTTPNTLYFTDDTGVDHNLGAAGTGDVVGPAGATDHALCRFDTATGKLIQDSTTTLTDAGDMTVNGSINVTGNVDGRDVSADGTALDGHVASTANPHTVTLAQALAGDNVTGGTNIEIESGDALISTAGSGGGAGANLPIGAGDGNGAGAGGDTSIAGGAAPGAGAGGDVSLASGNSVSGNAGDITGAAGNSGGANVGGEVTWAGGTGGATGAGGVSSGVGGSGGATSGAGGAGKVYGGSGGPASPGGDAELVGGAGGNLGNGGEAHVYGGEGGATGHGGPVEVYGGLGGVTSGNGGETTVRGGNAQTAGAGGALNCFAGQGAALRGGHAYFKGGAAGVNSDGGNAIVESGVGHGIGDSGYVYIHTGNAGATGDSGNILLETGTAAGGTKGHVRVTNSDFVIVLSTVAHGRVTEVAEYDGSTTGPNTAWSLTLPDDSATRIEAKVTAMKTDGSQRAFYIRRVGVYRNGGGATIQGSVDATWTEESDGTWDCTFDVNSNDVRLRVTGPSGVVNLRWRATLEYQQVT